MLARPRANDSRLCSMRLTLFFEAGALAAPNCTRKDHHWWTEAGSILGEGSATFLRCWRWAATWPPSSQQRCRLGTLQSSPASLWGAGQYPSFLTGSA